MSTITPNTHIKYRPDIDALRALAIIAVVTYHAFPTILPGGFVGVDVFFVISGYLISSIVLRSLRNGSFSFSDFYVKRIRRIFPALVVVLAATYLFGWFSLFPDEFIRLGNQTVAGALFFQNFHLWHEAGYFVSLAESMPLLHLWSLSVEEQFYLVFPLVAWLAYRRSLNVGVLIFFLLVVSLSLCLYLSHNELHAVQAFYLPHTRVWEILTGSLLAYAQVYRSQELEKIPTGARSAFRHVAPIVGLCLIAVAAVTFDKFSPFPGWRALLPVSGTFLLIAAGPSSPVNRMLLCRRPLIWIGLISYPLYLWHWPLLSYAKIISAGEPSSGVRFGAAALSVVLAWATYQFIERPIRFSPQLARVPATLIASLVCASIVGAATVRGDGFEFREAAADANGNRFDYPYKKSCAALMGSAFREDWCNADSIRTAPPRVVMTGDSFANAFSTIVHAHFANNGIPQTDFAQFGRGECPALLGYGPKYCQDLTDASAKFIISTPSVETVILAANWPAYYSEKNYHGNGPNQTHQQFMDALRRTIEFYQQAEKRVVVFLSTPQDTNPRGCVSRRIQLSIPPEGGNCTYPLTNALRGDSDYRVNVVPYLESKGVAMFDPFKFMCNDETCRVSADGKILYSDSGHISAAGGTYLADTGRQVLSSLLSSPSPERQSIAGGLAKSEGTHTQ
ncbi:acyltransferase family protein [Pandoraea sputorum]|uniref:acyltransferase family protein n=1 Tax=Pandoraea sputorum TaxID=93222 RepID=UPI001242AD12|nr:acyltransferase family protein [Pandoraea sputorum]VVE06265.1 O-acetyltransferase OatA [Pandoraea sputorum]